MLSAKCYPRVAMRAARKRVGTAQWASHSNIGYGRSCGTCLRATCGDNPSLAPAGKIILHTIPGLLTGKGAS